jgi:hypothetical protein
MLLTAALAEGSAMVDAVLMRQAFGRWYSLTNVLRSHQCSTHLIILALTMIDDADQLAQVVQLIRHCPLIFAAQNGLIYLRNNTEDSNVEEMYSFATKISLIVVAATTQNI